MVVFTLLKKEDLDKEEVQKAEKTQAVGSTGQAGDVKKEEEFTGDGDDDVD